MPSAPQRALELYGIISLDVSGATSPVRGVNVVCRSATSARWWPTRAYAAPAATPQHIAEYRRVVEGAFARQTIVPAPFGVRLPLDATRCMRWLELHYFTLVEAVTFVADRAMARVVRLVRR